MAETDLAPMGAAELQLAAAHRKANAALILSILGIVLLPVVSSILGVIFGFQAHRMLKAHPGAPGGGRAIAAMALGVTSLLLVGLYVTLR